jgi:hypothetical protein
MTKMSSFSTSIPLMFPLTFSLRILKSPPNFLNFSDEENLIKVTNEAVKLDVKLGFQNTFYDRLRMALF